MTRRFFRIFVLALVGLLAAQISSRADATDTTLVKSAVLEGSVAYLRIGQVGKNLADEIRAAQTALAVSNKIAGTVLDLRFAGGDDLDSAKATVDLFASEKLPLAILVNVETTGAAGTLASDLRAAHAGLVFESESGTAQTGGEQAGLAQPDIVVTVGPKDERAFMQNPYAAPAQIDTNATITTNGLLPLVDHTSEADLVRARIKDGDQDENSAPQLAPEQPSAPQPQVIRDPVLARAVDLIKGLAVVRASHS